MASWLIRMVSSLGTSSRKRRAICSGLHAVAHRRGCRRPCRRPFQGTTGPRTAALPGPQTSPASLSCTYPRSAAFTASFAGFGRRAARSACHCAVVARYASPPLRVAALRRSSREIVDAARPSRRAICRMPWPCARPSAISSRSANDRYRSDGGFADGANILGGMPPASRNQRAPTAGDTPTSIAAASLNRPTAIAAQNRRRLSRCATPGRPGDRGNTARSARSERRFPALIATPSVKVLRRPLEPKRGLPITEMLQELEHRHKRQPPWGQAGLAPSRIEAAEVLVRVERVERVAQARDHRALGEGRPGDARGLGRDLTDRFRTQAHGSPLCQMADRIRRRYLKRGGVPEGAGTAS